MIGCFNVVNIVTFSLDIRFRSKLPTLARMLVVRISINQHQGSTARKPIMCLLREGKKEDVPLPFHAFGPYLAAMRLDNAFTDGEAKAGTFSLSPPSR